MTCAPAAPTNPRPPPALVQAIKVCSASFKNLEGEELAQKQRFLSRLWWAAQRAGHMAAHMPRAVPMPLRRQHPPGPTLPCPLPPPRRNREVNAHLLLHDQPRVVRAFHTFQGTMVVPPAPGDEVQAPRQMQASRGALHALAAGVGAGRSRLRTAGLLIHGAGSRGPLRACASMPRFTSVSRLAQLAGAGHRGGAVQRDM